jgi:hypothetical protein
LNLGIDGPKFEDCVFVKHQEFTHQFLFPAPSPPISSLFQLLQAPRAFITGRDPPVGFKTPVYSRSSEGALVEQASCFANTAELIIRQI